MALVTAVTTVYGAEETAIQKCWHHILDAKDNQQRKATIAFKDCVRKETSTSTSTSKLKWPKSADKAEKELEKQIKLEEKERIKAERKKTCAANPNSEDCKKATAALDNIKGLFKILKNMGGKKIGEPG